MNYIYSLLNNQLNSNSYFIDEQNKLSYNDMNRCVMNIAKELKDIGVKIGSKVAIVLDDKPLEFIKFLFATSYLGAIPFPIYTKSGEDKIISIIEYFEIDFAVGKLKKYKDNWQINGLYTKTNIGGNNDLNINTELVLFTSGTTSMPKAIMLSKKNIQTNVEGISEYLKLTKNDSVFLIKNLNHSSTIVGELLMGVYNGVDIYLTNKIYTINNVEKTIKDNNITVLFAVPTIIKNILEKGKTENLDSLKVLNFYGGKLSKEDIKKLCDALPNCEIVYSYGLTEAAPRVTYIMKDDQIKHLGSSGKCIKNVAVSIENNGQTAKPNEVGQIVVHGDNVMLGYYKNEEKTARTIINGNLYTGDLGYIDSEGFLYVVGRMDNMCIYAGKNVYLEEIESTIMSYPGVLEALAVPIYNENEVIGFKAYVSMKDKIEFNYKNIFDYCIKNIEVYKIPKEIIYVDSLEKTASGKIKRKQSFMEEHNECNSRV